MSGLGGGGFMVVAKADGRAEVLDFGMLAPAALDPPPIRCSGGRDGDLFGWPGVVEDRNVLGPLSIAVPGQAGGLGPCPRAPCQPALARSVRAGDRAGRAGPAGRLVRLPADRDRGARSGALSAGRRPLSAGRPAAGAGATAPACATCRRRALARTLRRLADAGPQDLVTGELAHALVADMREAGGVLDARGSRRLPRTGVEPLVRAHGGVRILTPGGLTAGPTLDHALALIARQDPARRAAGRRLSSPGRRPVRGLRAAARQPRPWRRERAARRLHQPSVRRSTPTARWSA